MFADQCGNREGGCMFWLVLLVLWLALPLALIPSVIVLSIKKSNLEKEILALRNGENPENVSGIRNAKKLRDSMEKKPLKLSIMLMIGVLFVILAGVIFVTTNWNSMSGILKTFFVMSMSILFFAASEISERRLSLDKTGFAFFTLGGIFLPVSVIGTAFFELLGKWFAVEGDGFYAVLLAVLAVTALVFIAGNIKYKGSPFIRYLFGTLMAFEFVCFAFELDTVVNNSIYSFGLLPAIMMTAALILSLIIPQIKCPPVQTVFIVSMISFYTFESKELFGAVLAFICVVIAVLFNEKIYSAVVSFAVPLTWTGAVSVFCRQYEIGINATYKATYIVALVSLALFSLVTHLLKISENKKLKWVTRSCDLAVLIISYMSGDAFSGYYDGHKWIYDIGWIVIILCAAVYFAVSAIFYCTRTEKNICFSFSALLVMTAAIAAKAEEMFALPEIIETEYFVLMTFILSISLKFIWKRFSKATEIILFLHTAAAIFVLMLDVFDGFEEADILILAGICTLMTVFSYILKKKKWFILSAVSLVILVFYTTKEIWLSISWWVYLLSVGMIFIIFAGVNEYCRMTGKDFNVKIALKEAKKYLWNNKR